MNTQLSSKKITNSKKMGGTLFHTLLSLTNIWRSVIWYFTQEMKYHQCNDRRTFQTFLPAGQIQNAKCDVLTIFPFYTEDEV